MQVRHVSCLMGHLSREPIVGGFWLGTSSEWREVMDAGQMQGLGNGMGCLRAAAQGRDSDGQATELQRFSCVCLSFSE